MVDLNLTLIVELLLFLIFLWGCNRFIFKPTLALMDERNDKILQDQETALAQEEEASDTERRYNHEVVQARREAARRIDEARRSAMEERNRLLVERRRGADEQVNNLRQEARKQVRDATGQIEPAADELASRIAEQIRLKGLAQ
jgi:F-type H+-transporting ATPase subunit b